jgi:leader peptidase (prepilin peptidase)/N-methyltransferase
LPGIPEATWTVIAFMFGAIIGSFLNVVIWRMPRGENLSHPASHCPFCDRKLAAWENIPFISFLALRARCRTCKHPISWRYFGVELLTAVLFAVLERHFGPTVETVAYCLFAAALIPAFFIDLELFIIPDQLNTFALFCGIALDIWGILHHDPHHALLWGWLPRSILGAIICAGVFVFIQVLGYALFKKESMGDGDVKLARAIGAMLPIGQALVSFLLAIGTGAVIGIGMILWQKTRPVKGQEEDEQDEGSEEEEENLPPVPILHRLSYLVFLDLLIQFGAFLRIPAAVKIYKEWGGELLEDEEDDFVAGPTHIPFGPYMIAGAFLALFVGDRIVQWYLHFSGLVK